jgi:hypothetical protein
VPKISKKKRREKWGELWVSGFLWKKWENRKKWWPVVDGSGGERPAVAREWWVCDGWW